MGVRQIRNAKRLGYATKLPTKTWARAMLQEGSVLRGRVRSGSVFGVSWHSVPEGLVNLGWDLIWFRTACWGRGLGKVRQSLVGFGRRYTTSVVFGLSALPPKTSEPSGTQPTAEHYRTLYRTPPPNTIYQTLPNAAEPARSLPSGAQTSCRTLPNYGTPTENCPNILYWTLILFGATENAPNVRSSSTSSTWPQDQGAPYLHGKLIQNLGDIAWFFRILD